MATMHIDNDIRAALSEERITWAEAGEIQTLRRKWRRASKRSEKMRERYYDVLKEAKSLWSRLTTLEHDKMGLSATEQSTEPGQEEEIPDEA